MTYRGIGLVRAGPRANRVDSLMSERHGGVRGGVFMDTHADGGLHLSRISSSLIIVAFIIGCVLFTSQQPDQPADQRGSI
ncbi:MAG TPA: hypothetical protein VKT26_04915 [Acetobacteraceae bacterium]|nr:hypothetical protein [Acetobacteraceae bacterium]